MKPGHEISLDHIHKEILSMKKDIEKIRMVVEEEGFEPAAMEKFRRAEKERLEGKLVPWEKIKKEAGL